MSTIGNSMNNSKPKLLYKVLCNTIDERNILFEILHFPPIYSYNIIQEYMVNIPKLLNKESITYLIYDDKTVDGISTKFINENTISVTEYKNKIIMTKERNILISLEQAVDMYKSDNSILRDMALKTFPELPEILEQSKYPKTWKELCKIKEGNIGYCINTCGNTLKTSFENHHNYQNTISTEERANTLLLLGQLLEIRDEWNRIDNFTPDFSGNSHYCITRINKTINIVIYKEIYHLFAFKTSQTAKLFMETFKIELEKVLSI